MSLRTQPLQENFGIEVLDVDLSHINDDTFDEIYQLWQQDPLLLFRRQSLTESVQVDFSRRFGDLDQIVRDDMHSPLNPEIIYITSLLRPDATPLGGLGAYEVRWHHDQVYRQRPASGSIFYGIEMPEGGGRTSWANTALAYDNLSENLAARIEGAQATCKYGRKVDQNASIRRDFVDDPDRLKVIDERTPPATHNVVLENPITGAKSIYFDPNKTIVFEGMSEDETQDLVTALSDHIVQDKFVYTHEWRNGDVVMWDNARLWHRREAFDESLPRLAKRTTIFLHEENFAVPEPGFIA